MSDYQDSLKQRPLKPPPSSHTAPQNFRIPLFRDSETRHLTAEARFFVYSQQNMYMASSPRRKIVRVLSSLNRLAYWTRGNQY